MKFLLSTSIPVTQLNQTKVSTGNIVALSQTCNIKSIDCYFTYSKGQMPVNWYHIDIPARHLKCSPNTRLTRLHCFYMATLIASNKTLSKSCSNIVVYSYFQVALHI